MVCGEVVIRQGDKGNEMFIVESGRLEASIITPEGKDIGVVKTYGGGEYFGELALVSDDPRSATVTVTETSTLLVLMQADVTKLLRDMHGSELSKRATAEALDPEFQKALKRRSNRRGAVVQQTDARTGLVKLASNSNSQLNPLRRSWANDLERSRETDVRAVSTSNALSKLGELQAAALAGDLVWVQQVMQPEVEAGAILKQVEPEIARLRRILNDVTAKIREQREAAEKASADLARGRCGVDKMNHRKSLLEQQLDRSRSMATAAMAKARSTNSGQDAEMARLAIGTVKQLEERMDEMIRDIAGELHAGNVGTATKRLEDAEGRLKRAENEHEQLQARVAAAEQSMRYAQGTVQYVNLPDKLGRTAVHFAVEGGHLSILVHLHKNRAKLDIQDVDGRNIFHIAAIREHREIVEYLLEQDVRNLLLQTDKQGASALFAASYQGNARIVDGIIAKHSGNLNTSTVDGTTPLFIACECGNIEVVRVLVVNRANVESSRKGGFTPLYIACQQRHNDVVGLLLASKADVDHATHSGLTPFTACCHGGALDLAKMLKEGGACAEKPTRGGRTACWVAAHSGRLKVLRWLAEECGVDVERPDNAGVTPLQTACENAQVAVAEYICSLPCLPAVALRRSRLLCFITEFKNVHSNKTTFAERVQAAKGTQSTPGGAAEPLVVTVSSKSRKRRSVSRLRRTLAGGSTSDSGSEDTLDEHGGWPPLSDTEVTAVDADGRPLSRGLTPESQHLLRIGDGDSVSGNTRTDVRKSSSPAPRLGRRRGAVVLEEYLAQSVLGTGYQSQDTKLTGVSKRKSKKREQQQLVNPVTPPLTLEMIRPVGRSSYDIPGQASPWATSDRSFSERVGSENTRGRKQLSPNSGLISPAASKRLSQTASRRRSSRTAKETEM